MLRTVIIQTTRLPTLNDLRAHILDFEAQDPHLTNSSTSFHTALFTNHRPPTPSQPYSNQSSNSSGGDHNNRFNNNRSNSHSGSNHYNNNYFRGKSFVFQYHLTLSNGEHLVFCISSVCLFFLMNSHMHILVHDTALMSRPSLRFRRPYTKFIKGPTPP